ncbi:hypothetical protein BD410DRAFT_790010 [Rickenella mellea]|uniref:Retrotransposon Copia-like N-terminal domain-containing protein n=1 Tax=Rickenella mellea TaxID=50990 RepID=A0A4Y7Q1S0_9AGAM|nr:hypothetical protein BD410DRAFT_790010 [Rickenella mellea]
MSLLPNAVNVYTIPKLKPDGSNWVTWKTQTLTLLGAKGLKRHVEGTARQPPKAPVYPPEHTLTEEEEEDLEKASTTHS